MVYDELNRVIWTFDAELGGGAYQPSVFAWDGRDYQCGEDGTRWVDGLCTSRISGGTPNDRFGAGGAPAAYDSDRLRVVAVGSWDGTHTATFLLARGNRQPVNFVDWRNSTPPGDGTVRNPFNTVQDAIPCASDGSTLFIQSGTYQAGPITIWRRVDLIPLGGSVTIR
jgi:hypothetical protein